MALVGVKDLNGVGRQWNGVGWRWVASVHKLGLGGSGMALVGVGWRQFINWGWAAVEWRWCHRSVKSFLMCTPFR